MGCQKRSLATLPLVCFTWRPPMAGRRPLHYWFPWLHASQPRNSTIFPTDLSGGRFPSSAALTGSLSGPLSKVLRPTFPPLSLLHVYRCFSLGSCCRRRSISINYILPLPTSHGLEYPLSSRFHMVVVHPPLGATGRQFPRSWGSADGRITAYLGVDAGTSGSTLTPVDT